MKKLSILIAFLGFAGGSIPTHATTFANRPIKEVVKETTHIVRGRTGESYSNWGKGQDTQAIFTYTHFEVIEVIKGSIKERKILLRQPGGAKDGVEMHVPGAAQFARDEEVVALLGPIDPNDNSYDMPGLTTWKYDVKNENGEVFIENSLGGAAVYDPNKDSGTLSYNARIKLDSFKAIVRGEDVPEAKGSQFQQSKSAAPAGAYEADHGQPGHKHTAEEPTPAEIAANEEAVSGMNIWLPISFILMIIVGGVIAYRLMKRKDD